MLAINSKLSATALMTGLFMFAISSALGQQTPSQRYQPVPSITNSSHRHATPSAHMPPQQIEQLQSGQQGVRYNLSDSAQLRATNNRYGKTAQPLFEPPVMRGNIQKASFQTDASGEPVVPSILLGSPPAVLSLIHI